MTERRRRNVALLVAGCLFMEILDATIVTTSAPQIGASLGVPASSVGLVITAYLVTVAALIPVSGWLAARWGTRPVFLAAIALFTLASAGCAASTSLTQLVAMRVLQGAAGAMMVPVGRLEVLADAPKGDLMRVISFLIWPALVAPVIAPLLGGAITTYASWHWIFLINVPLGIAAFIVGWRLIRPVRLPEPPPLDRLGLALTVAGLGGITYSAELLSHSSPNWRLVAVLGGASLALLLLAVRHLLRVPQPLVNLRTLRIHSFGAATRGSSIFWLAVGAMAFLLPLFFQQVFDWSPVKAGAIVLFLFAGNLGIKPATTPLYNRFGFRAVLIGATAGLAATIAVTGLLRAETPLLLVILVVALGGIARSIGLTGYNTLAFEQVPEAEMRDANALSATAQQLFAGLGVALATVALRAGEALTELSGDADLAAAYTVAFLLIAAVAALAWVSALRLDRRAGEVLRQPRPS